MTDITSFVKLSPKEAVLDRWQVMRHRERLPGEKVFIGIGVFVVLYLILKLLVGLGIAGLGTAFDRPVYVLLGYPPVRLMFFLIEIGIPALWALYPIWMKPREEGQLALTNRRLLFVTQGRALRRNVINVTAVNLVDVLGIHSVYSENRIGRKTLKFIVHTRFRDGLVFETDQSHSWIGWLPLIGDPLARNSVTSDAIAMLPVLFNRIQSRAGTEIGSTASY